MKKIAIVFLSLMIMVSMAQAEVDLTAYDTQELIELEQAIQTELSNRSDYTEANIHNGIFVAGKDIKPGTYAMRCTKPTSGIVWYISVYDSEAAYEEGNRTFTLGGTVQETIQINLEEGMVLKIDFGSGIIKPVSYDWMM